MMVDCFEQVSHCHLSEADDNRHYNRKTLDRPKRSEK